MNRFRIRSCKFFLTYPQCNVKKEEAYEYLMVTFSPKQLLVAHELHANGDNHLHAYIEFEDCKEFTSPNCFDIGPSHGNYQGCRSAKNVVKYCTKKDDYISTFDVSTVLKGRTIEKAVIGRRYVLALY